MKYLKWVFKEKLNNKERPLKIDDVTICHTWDPDNPD